jgi:hypothetical protein
MIPVFCLVLLRGQRLPLRVLPKLLAIGSSIETTTVVTLPLNARPVQLSAGRQNIPRTLDGLYGNRR